MLPKADLHIHTTCSDGRLTPTEAVELAKEKKLRTLSITDHDTFEGYFEAIDKARELDIELVPGVEITCSFRGREAHMLAYYFSTDTNYFADFLTSQRVARRDRIKGIIHTLNGKGLDVDYPEVRAEANGANIGRPHVAKILIKKGYARSSHDAFMRYLSTEKLGDIENSYPDFREAIEIVKNIGGATVLAHPGRLYSDSEVQEFIEAGIDGLECIHPSHNWTLQKKYTELTEKHSLLMTGGSDYHGGKEMAYTHLGVVTIAAKHCDKMKRMTDQRKNIVDLKK
jgi:hypothetical protein